MIRLLVLLTLALTIPGDQTAQTPTPAPDPPRLVVVLVVDQMRSGYLDAYGSHFEAGLRRLMRDGAWFRHAAYPYLNTVTCPGHSTISTGALPYQHGMVLNAWWDREQQRSRGCTLDPSVKNIGYTHAATGGDSAASLLARPLADALRASGGRSVALSLKARSSVTMVGRAADAVVWFSEPAGFVTSTAFTGGPVPWIDAFFKANPLDAYRGTAWERLLPVDAYQGADDGVGEARPWGWERVFPHTLGVPAASFLQHWQRSPYADEYLGRLAAHAIDSLKLGHGAGTDFLSVSFSSLDLVGHQFGPDSHEVQDMLFRLDRTIGRLLDHLDARVGRGRYVLALSADHGVATIPEKTGARRQTSAEVMATVNAALAPVFGPGSYVARAEYTDVYLAPGVFERVLASPQASAAVREALRTLPGIAQVFYSPELRDAAARESSDPMKRAAALSHYPPRSGDIIVIPQENWLFSRDATSHGTLYPYDQRVPVLFYGPGITAGIRTGTATPADIAPTLASLAGVSGFSPPYGRVLPTR